MTDPAVIAACFSDFRLVKGRKVYQIVCEVPMEQANAALAALGGLPNPHAERWVAIAPLAEQPQGANSGPVATPPTGAADQPLAATKPKRHWDDYSPSQQAGIACGHDVFQRWFQRDAPLKRWDGERAAAQLWWRRSGTPAPDSDETANYVRWYCGVTSRAELDNNDDAAARWRELYGRFEADTRYGGSVR